NREGGGDRVMVVSIAEGCECRHAMVANATPVACVNEREARQPVTVTLLSPIGAQLALEGALVRIQARKLRRKRSRLKVVLLRRAHLRPAGHDISSGGHRLSSEERAGSPQVGRRRSRASAGNKPRKKCYGQESG